MIFKIGTEKELEAVKHKLSQKLVIEIGRAVAILGHEYGADRDVDDDDGGFIVVVETVEDIEKICSTYVDMNRIQPEEVNILYSEKQYLSALYLKNNEFGISVVIPMGIAPHSLRREAIENGKI